MARTKLDLTKEKVFSLFKGKPIGLSKTAIDKLIGKSAQAKSILQELLNDKSVIKIGARYYSTQDAPTAESVGRQIESILTSTPKLFPKKNLKPKGIIIPEMFFNESLERLVDLRVIARFEVYSDKPPKTPRFYYLHNNFVGSKTSISSAGLENLDEKIRSAYGSLSRRMGRISVLISDLAREAGIEVATLQDWIREHIINQGEGTLDEGDWASASEEARQAAVEERGHSRTLIRLNR
jgi:hypothetical protein